MTDYKQKSMELFKEGYNCSQSVVLAFEDKLGLDRKTLLMLSSSFGGGMGRLREVCGTVSGMFMVTGLLYGYSSPTDTKGKTELYKEIQGLAEKFKQENRYIVCRDLLGIGDKKESYIPAERTDEYYKKRPCVELVGSAAEILSNFINEKEKEL